MKKRIEIDAHKTVYSGYFSLDNYVLKHERFDGSMSEPLQRELFCRRPAVGVILLDTDRDQIVLVEQFRIGALNSENPWLLEVVAGVIDKGETPEQTAEREVEEEAGVHVKRLERIMEYWVSPGACNEKLYLFCAQVDSRDVKPFGGLAAEHEDIRIHVIPIQEAFERLDKHEFVTAFTILPMQWLKLHYTDLKKRWNT